MQKYTFTLSGVLLLGFLFFVHTARADVTVYALSGESLYKAEGSNDWRNLKKDERLPLGGVVKVLKHSRLGLKFDDGRLLRLREESELKLEAASDSKEESLNLVGGALHLFNRLGQARYSVKTPEVSAAIRGTELVAISENGESTFTIFDGEAVLSAQNTSVRLSHQESAKTLRGQPPQKIVLTKPIDQVEWALYFPALFLQRDYEHFQSENRSAIAAAYELSFEGRYREALEKLRLESGADEHVRLLRGSLLTLLGSPQEAEKELSTVQSQNLRSAALAQRGIIALIKQDVKQAELLLSESYSPSPSAQSLLLASLLKTNRGEFRSALDDIEQALAKYSDEPTLLARKAEILLGLDRTKEAHAIAEQAALGRPKDSFIQSVLGFTLLARREVSEARVIFQKVLTLDPNLPEAHFGSGLALLGEGKLQEGRAALEQTVHLDSGRSLYRSYLGKAFFEEEQEDAAEKEFGLAIERDNNDPTPYLYRAFNRLSKNNVIGALSDVEESIERNDARAVYRSRSLLDQDLGVRTTSLAEVFRQLGFRDVARIEAMKSLSKDYTNFSAHRLLGEVLEGDFYADAKFSQRLISELLSPLSFNTFQAFNGFSAEPSNNDYAALFDRPAHRTNIELSATNVDDNYQGSVLQAGVVENLGYLASYSHRNVGVGDLREHNTRLAFQYQPVVEHRFLVEGELTNFDDEQSVELFERVDTSGAIGSYHRLSYQTELITRHEYFGRKVDTRRPDQFESATQTLLLGAETALFPEFFINLRQLTDENDDTVRSNIQLLHRTDDVSLISGGEYVYANGRAREESDITGDTLGIFDSQSQTRDSRGSYNTNTTSLYSYLQHHVAPWLDLQLGLSYRNVELPQYDILAPFLSGERNIHRFSPKAGFTLTPTDQLTVRGAYFQNLGASSVNDIGSLEPTVVGSFVQSLGDLPGNHSESLGLGVDYKEPSSFYTGVEYTYRDIKRTGAEVITDFTVDANALTDTYSLRRENSGEHEFEHLIRGYLYTILSDRFATLTEYRRENLEALDINEVNDTHRVRFGTRYFAASPWFALADMDWYNQYRRNVFAFEDGSDDFWVLNLGVGYRIPKRKGQIRFQLVNVLDQTITYASRNRFTDPPNGIGFLTDISFNF